MAGVRNGLAVVALLLLLVFDLIGPSADSPPVPSEPSIK